MYIKQTVFVIYVMFLKYFNDSVRDRLEDIMYNGLEGQDL